MIDGYQKRISGPMMDRIDIHVEVPRVEYEKLARKMLGEASADIRERVEEARGRQRARFEGSGLYSNADMGPKEVRQFCELDDPGRALVRAAMEQMGLSARAYHRMLKLARTISDLAGEEGIQVPHLAEALQYRGRRGE